MSKKSKSKGQPAPRWLAFLVGAQSRLASRCPGGIELAQGETALERFAAEIVARCDGPAFLKAVRRGRSTQRQNIRYQLLREVEKAIGDSVPRRRPDSNTPDAVALKINQGLITFCGENP